MGAKGPSTAKLRIWTLRIWGFRGPGFRSARQVFCGDASRLFLDHSSKHLSSVLGRTELCHKVRNPGPQNPKSSTIRTTTWYCSEGVSGRPSRKSAEKGLFPQISSDLLKPPSLKPPFAALQYSFAIQRITWKNALGIVFLENLISVT